MLGSLTRYRGMAATTILLAIACVLGVTACGQEPAGAPDRPSLAKILDRIEMRLDAYEQGDSGRYVDPIVYRYARELSEEYLGNRTQLAGLPGGSTRTDPSAVEEGDSRRGGRQAAEALRRRQIEISIMLWHLQRIGAGLASPFNRNSISFQLNRLPQSHRAEMQEDQFRDRYRALLTRSMIRRQRAGLPAIRRGLFYFVRPDRFDNGPEVDRWPSRRVVAPEEKLETIRDGIAALVRLELLDGKLSIDREHWGSAFAGHSLKDLEMKVVSELASRGLVIEDDDRSRRRGAAGYDRHPALLLFDDLHYQAQRGVASSAGRSRGAQVTRKDFRTGTIEGSLSFSDDSFEIRIRELAFEKRTLSVNASADGTLRIRLIGDSLMLLDQQSGGDIRWIRIESTEVRVRQAADFVQLRTTYGNEVRSSLLKTLSAVGIEITGANPSDPDR